MAMMLDLFVSRCIEQVIGFVEGEICKVLGVKKEIKTLQEKLEMIKCYLESAERKSRGDPGIEAWVRKLKDIMYDADDIIDLCMMDGGKLLEAGGSASASGEMKPKQNLLRKTAEQKWNPNLPHSLKIGLRRCFEIYRKISNGVVEH
nr:PREDICTED: probable disease resistance protein At1g59620 [Musa acuminata subsp. malaccensis]